MLESEKKNATGFTVTASLGKDVLMGSQFLGYYAGGAGTGWRVWGPPGSAAIAEIDGEEDAKNEDADTARLRLVGGAKRPQDLAPTGDVELDARLDRWARHFSELPTDARGPFLDRVERDSAPFGAGIKEQAKRNALRDATHGRVELRFHGMVAGANRGRPRTPPPPLVRGETRQIASGYFRLEQDFDFFPDCNEHLIGFRTAFPIPQDGGGSLVKAARKTE
jgi:hypothetical protein